jgi:hypothetical protein
LKPGTRLSLLEGCRRAPLIVLEVYREATTTSSSGIAVLGPANEEKKEALLVARILM